MSEHGINLNHALFRQEVAKHVDRIKQVCRHWGIPHLATHVTLILRDPTNDAMSFLLTDEARVADAYQVAQRLEQGEGQR